MRGRLSQSKLSNYRPVKRFSVFLYATVRLQPLACAFNNLELKGKLIEELQLLKACGFTLASSDLIVFRIAKGEAYFWTKKTNFDSKKVKKFG